MAVRLDAGHSRETFAVAVESNAWQDPAEVRRIEHQVAHEVVAEVDVRPRNVVVLGPGTIPKTPSGKLRRVEFRLAGHLPQDHLSRERPCLSGDTPVTNVQKRSLVGNEVSVVVDTVGVMPTTPAIEAIALVKRFGSTVAVDGVSFTVPPGSVLGLLGPNGAGKTTTVRMMATLTEPTSGTARVAGFDVRLEPEKVRLNMGLTGQVATVDELLTGRENIRMIGGLYGIRRKELACLGDDLLEQFAIADAADRVVKSYSGGMRRRLDLAVSLLASPPVLFLDEPTTGLDPRSRSELWEVLRGLVEQGTTLLLTTQYLEEADQLADNIVVIDKGRIIAQGSPLQLKRQAGNASLVVTVARADDLSAAQALLAKTGAEVFVDAGARQLTAAADGLADMVRVAGWLRDSDIDVDDIGLSRPSLDDVFLSLTGHRTEEEVGA